MMRCKATGWVRTTMGWAAVLLATAAQAQVPANGSFEANLTGWTVGGTNQVAVITPANMPCCITEAVDGTRFAALSTGPDDVAGGAAVRIDANTTDEVDTVTLSTTVTFTGTPAYLAFAWTMATSEQDQGVNYDDLFDVSVDNTVVFSRSGAKNDSSSYSNYPDAPRGPLTTAANRLITAAPPITNSNIRYGMPPFQVACVPIPATVAGSNTKTLRFRAADQNDTGFDTVVLIDQVRVVSQCGDSGSADLNALTTTSGNRVELKGGGIEFRPVQSSRVAADETGRDIAFASSANLTGDNPNVIDQVYLWNGAAFSRVTGLNILNGGAVDSLDLSKDTRNSIRGQYVAIAARINATDNTEIYRWNRQNNTLTTITTTAGCDNRNPSISDDGLRVVFDSNCAALTAAGTRRKIVEWYNGTILAGGGRPAGATCDARLPSLYGQAGSATSRLVAFESNCNPNATNNDGNWEIFRWGTGNTTYTQLTTTTGNVLNANAHISDTGTIIFYVSNLYDATGNSSMEIYRWNNGTTTRLTTSNNLLYYLNAPINTTGIRFGFERLNLLTGVTEIGHARTDQGTGGETVVAIDQGEMLPAFGLDTTEVVLTFPSVGNHDGTNADGNADIFQFRGE